MFDFFTKHRKLITVLIILISIIAILGVPVLVYGSNLKLQKIALFAEIISSFFVIAGVVIAVWQYYISSRSEICKIKTDNIRKAIDLAGYYKDNILLLYIRIKVVYENTGIKKILDSVLPNKMSDFDTAELEEIFTVNQVQMLKKLSSMNAMLHNNSFKIQDNTEETFEEMDVHKREVINDFISLNVNQTLLLNNLEYFAMNFTHKTADESVVFHSLAPTYLEIVRMMYYQISRNNIGKEHKYYTNVIELYNMWNEETNKIINKDKNSKKTKYSCGTVVDNNI